MTASTGDKKAREVTGIQGPGEEDRRDIGEVMDRAWTFRGFGSMMTRSRGGTMRAVVQRVLEARVDLVGADGEVVEEAGRTRPGAPGLMVLLGAGHGDTVEDANWMARKICGLRIFADERGHMNRSVVDVEGSLLVVSQFTLYGDCRKGRRPSFVGAMEPEAAAALIERFVAVAQEEVPWVQTGEFGAHMRVELTNEGPVTLILDSPG